MTNNGDEDLSESEDDGDCLILDADDCTCCVANNGDEGLSESKDGVVGIILDAGDCACGWAHSGDGESDKIS